MLEIPEWLATMVGRLVIENQAMMHALQERTEPPGEPGGAE
jgi:hypothetical protein